MKTIQRVMSSTVVITMFVGLSACSGMSTREKNTAIGAGVGAVGGAVLTGGGAVVGGVIGHEVNK